MARQRRHKLEISLYFDQPVTKEQARQLARDYLSGEEHFIMQSFFATEKQPGTMKVKGIK